MPMFSSKHNKREDTFRFDSFHDGYTQEKESIIMEKSELSACKNLRYVKGKSSQKVTLEKRPGTTIISNTSIPSKADILACTYYINQSQYIVATATKIYYLDSSDDPVEIGTIEGIPTFTEFHSKLIIHDGETTKSWDGTIFEKLHRLFVDELLATGDDVEDEFSGTLDHPEIIEYGGHDVETPLEITYTATDAKTIEDEGGTGRLTGDVDSSWVKSIVDITDNAGTITIQANAHGFDNGDEINISGVTGTIGVVVHNTTSNPTWTVENVNAPNEFDLADSVFSGAYTSGGTVSKNTIIYSTGAYAFMTDVPPDDGTLVEASYEEHDGGEESNAGFIRASRLYLTGCPDHPSRLYYTGVNDEKAVDSSAGGGYLDIDPDDGYELKGALNFETSIFLGKEAALYRIDDYPGDATFKVEKITDDLGFVTHRAHLFEGELISFMSKEGWTAMHPSERYGDIQKGVPISKSFETNAARFANSFAYSAYNPHDKQLWLALYDGSSYLNYIYVVGLETGGQLSLYEFSFQHSCFSYVNGEMLIGGKDGNLYKLDNTDRIFTDNGVDYSDDCYMKTAYTDWGLSGNWKHNKELRLRLSGNSTVTADINIYKNWSSVPHKTINFTMGGYWGRIYNYSGISVYSLSGSIIGAIKKPTSYKYKFNYESIKIGIENIKGNVGVGILGIDLKTAIMGDK